MELIYCVALLTIIKLINGANISPKVIEITPNQIIEEGGTVLFTCVIENANDYTIGWRYSGGSMLSVDSTVTGANSRYIVERIDHNATLTTYTLEIRDIVAVDADTFACEIFDHATEVHPQLKVELDILKPRIFTTSNVYSSIDQSREAGDDVILVCSGQNVIPNACYWSKLMEDGEWRMVAHNGHSIQPRFKSMYQTVPSFRCSLKMENITSIDDGEYACNLLFSPFETIRLVVRLVVD